MGIIKTQTIQSSIYIYIGVFVGFANSALLIPNLLEVEQVGLINLINSISGLFVGFCALGVPLIAVKLFPRYRDYQSQHHGFFSFVFIVTILGFIIGIVAYLLFENQLLSEKNDARFFKPFFISFCFLFGAKLVFKNFDAYLRMTHRTVLGAFLDNFVWKIFITILLVSYWYTSHFKFEYFFVFYIGILSIPGLFQVMYILYKKEFNLKIQTFINFKYFNRTKIATLSIYGLLGTLGSIIVLEVDKLMISNMMDLEATGIYSIAFFFGLFINIPARGLKRVAQVIVSDLWKDNKVAEIRQLYRKSCLTQFLVGSYLLLGIWINIDYVFSFLPTAYANGKYVILFIGAGQLADMMTGVNTEIIASSKFYKYNTYFIGSLIALVVLFNWLLIPLWGIEGAAIASASSMIIVNLTKFFFLNRKINFQPLNSKFIITVILSFTSYALIYFLVPKFDNPFFGILVTGSTLTVIYWLPAYVFRISEDINNVIDKYTKR